MALTVTPGSETADSYATLAEFKAYADAIGYSYAGVSDASLEVALRKAAQYLDRAYHGKWKGFRSAQTQALAWPRTGNDSIDTGGRYRRLRWSFGVIDVDGYEIATDTVPVKVKHAQSEMAIIYLASTDPLAPIERGGQVVSEEVQAGPVSTRTQWAQGAPALPSYPKVEALLRGLVVSHPGAGVSVAQVVRG